MKIHYFIFAVVFFSQFISTLGFSKLTKSKNDSLLEATYKILCSFNAKTMHIYFENRTSLGDAASVLQELNACGTSYISLRNKFRTDPIEAIKDDGVVSYLLMMLHNASQPLELSIIQKESAAKHLSYVIIIIRHSEDITAIWLRSAFKKFWLKWFLNVVILFWRDNHLQIYRYNPFSEDFLIKVNSQGSVPRFHELFPRGLPNMHRKPLRVCLYHDEIRAIFRRNGNIVGNDGLLSGFIADRLNATRIVNHVSTYGYENRTADLCFGEIFNGIDDIALNIRFLSLPTFNRKVESTIVHIRDDLCVVVPKAKIASTFWNLFRSFTRVVWFFIVFAFLVAYGCYALLHGRTGLNQNLALQLFGSCLALPFHHPPLKFSIRLFLFCWLFYTMLISGTIKGTLTSNLVFHTYLPDINTIRELALSPYQLLTFPRHLKHLERFLNVSNSYEAMIKQKVKIIPDASLIGTIRSNNISYAYLQKQHVARYLVNSRNHHRSGRPIFYIMDTCLIPFHAVFIVPYGSPYLGYINNLVQSSHEFGFDNHWKHLMKPILDKPRRNHQRSERSETDLVILRLGHLKAAFSIWAVGLFLATLAFFWEFWGKNVKSEKEMDEGQKQKNKTMQKQKHFVTTERISSQE